MEFGRKLEKLAELREAAASHISEFLRPYDKAIGEVIKNHLAFTHEPAVMAALTDGVSLCLDFERARLVFVGEFGKVYDNITEFVCEHEPAVVIQTIIRLPSAIRHIEEAIDERLGKWRDQRDERLPAAIPAVPGRVEDDLPI